MRGEVLGVRVLGVGIQDSGFEGMGSKVRVQESGCRN
jgi:hypothetical protein